MKPYSTLVRHSLGQWSAYKILFTGALMAGSRTCLIGCFAYLPRLPLSGTMTSTFQFHCCQRRSYCSSFEITILHFGNQGSEQPQGSHVCRSFHSQVSAPPAVRHRRNRPMVTESYHTIFMTSSSWDRSHRQAGLDTPSWVPRASFFLHLSSRIWVHLEASNDGQSSRCLLQSGWSRNDRLSCPKRREGSVDWMNSHFTWR